MRSMIKNAPNDMPLNEGEGAIPKRLLIKLCNVCDFENKQKRQRLEICSIKKRLTEGTGAATLVPPEKNMKGG